MTPKNSQRPSSPTWKPHDYQLKAMKFLLEHAAAGLFLKPGLGKTSCTLGAFEFLRKRGMARRMLIVAPLRVCHSVWPREAQKWADFQHLKVCVLHGHDKESLLSTDADIFLINYEALEWLLGATKIAKRTMQVDPWRMRQLECDVIVFDELSRVKNHGSNRFTALRHVLHMFGRRWGLTGSPAPNGLIDLWAECFCLDLGRSLGPYISNFRRTYFSVDRSGFVYTPMPGMEERIYERIAPLVLQMGDDLIALPELRENIILVDLPEKVMATYRAMETAFLTAVDDKVVTAATAAAASMKIRQIAAGGLYHDTAPGKPKTWSQLHDHKIDALEELVGELQGSPLLTAYEFQHDVDRLKRRFPKATYVCDLSTHEFDRVVDRWNAGGIDHLIGHPASMGHGLNLQGCGTDVCFLNQTWNFELLDQFIRRVYRQGQKRAVTVHHIIASGTIEEKVLGVIRGKDRTQSALFSALKKLAQEKLHAR